MDTIWRIVADQWPTWLIATSGTAALWTVTHWLAKPLVAFREHRDQAIQTVKQYGSVGPFSSEERQEKARQSLANTAAVIGTYASGATPAVRVYCWLRRYDLLCASRMLNGLHHLTSVHVRDELRRNQVDGVCVALGATHALTRGRVQEVRRMMRDAEALD